MVAGLAAAALLVTLDRFIKVYLTLNPARGGVVLAGWLNIRTTANPTIAFGLPFPSAWLPVLTFPIIVAFSWWWWQALRHHDHPTVAALAFVVLGASSNLVDRLRWGHVIDYIDVPVFTVFNLADVMITIGVGTLILRELIHWWQRGNTNPRS